MKHSRFSEEQIVGILKEAEGAEAIRGVCVRHNITERAFFQGRSKFGGMDVAEARRLREIERENTELMER